MTAVRVIDDHRELENVGSLTHSRIDDYLNDTAFIVYSGSTELPSGSRQLVGGSGILITDGGPGGSVTISATASGAFVYPSDLTVTLSGGKTFGKYASGETIPATGKTPAEVIMMAIAEPIPPTLSLAGANILTSAFNTTGSVTTSLTASYTINSSGAAVSAVHLQHRSGGLGSWVDVSTNTSNPLLFDHTFTATPFFVDVLNYRYIVTDDQGASATASINLTPQPYSPPTLSLVIVRSNPGSITGETNSKRERGNVGSIISGLITRQRVNVPIISYSVQYSSNGSTWTDVPGLSAVPVAGNPPSVTIPATLHYEPLLLGNSSIYYRITVTDSYTTTNSSTSTINFLRTIFYGPTTSEPTDSTAVRSLGGKVFVDHSNPFNLETGSTERFFTVAIPATLSVTEVLDLDALNANITANYVLSTFDVEDGGGTSVSYRVYTMTNAIPYTSNHRHRVTRA